MSYSALHSPTNAPVCTLAANNDSSAVTPVKREDQSNRGAGRLPSSSRSYDELAIAFSPTTEMQSSFARSLVDASNKLHGPGSAGATAKRVSANPAAITTSPSTVTTSSAMSALNEQTPAVLAGGTWRLAGGTPPRVNGGPQTTLVPLVATDGGGGMYGMGLANNSASSSSLMGGSALAGGGPAPATTSPGTVSTATAGASSLATTTTTTTTTSTRDFPRSQLSHQPQVPLNPLMAISTLPMHTSSSLSPHPGMNGALSGSSTSNSVGSTVSDNRCGSAGGWSGSAGGVGSGIGFGPYGTSFGSAMRPPLPPRNTVTPLFGEGSGVDLAFQESSLGGSQNFPLYEMPLTLPPVVAAPSPSPLMSAAARYFTSPAPHQVAHCVSPPSISRELTPALPLSGTQGRGRRIDDANAAELRKMVTQLCCRVQTLEGRLFRAGIPNTGIIVGVPTSAAAPTTSPSSAAVRPRGLWLSHLEDCLHALRANPRAVSVSVVVALCLLLIRLFAGRHRSVALTLR